MTVLETCLILRLSSFSILQTISPSTPDSVNLVRVVTAKASNSDASSRASTTAPSSNIELKALLVSGKQVFSGQGLSVSMHPEDADARRMRAMANALCTLPPGRMAKYAFLSIGRDGASAWPLYGMHSERCLSEGR